MQKGAAVRLYVKHVLRADWLRAMSNECTDSTTVTCKCINCVMASIGLLHLPLHNMSIMILSYVLSCLAWCYFCVCLNTRIKLQRTREMTQSEMPFWEQREVFRAKINNIWERQPLDPSIHYIICVITPCSSVLNKLLNPDPCYFLITSSQHGVERS